MQKENIFTEEKRTKLAAPGLSNSKKKDSSGKIIFGDPVLCAQFLDGYVDIPMLKNVRPEDIEDISNRYVHMFTEERNSDVVKRVHIKDEAGKNCLFISYLLLSIRTKWIIM